MQDSKFKVHAVNGIWTKEGADNATTDRLLRDLAKEGFQTSDINYPKMGAFLAYSKRLERKHAKVLLDAHTKGDVAIGHSRGALVVWRACKMGAKFSTIVLFAPAMDADLEWPEGCADKIVIVYDERDKALALGRLLPFHRFGTLGKYGYEGTLDDRIWEVDALAYTTQPYDFDWLRHSHYFRNLNIWTQKVIQWISFQQSPSLPHSRD